MRLSLRALGRSRWLGLRADLFVALSRPCFLKRQTSPTIVKTKETKHVTYDLNTLDLTSYAF